MRPWLALRAAGIPFEERLFPLYTPEFAAAIPAYSPAGKVPVLMDGDVRVWESLAILDYLAEKFPQAGLWPAAPAARAHARAIAAEMHAGFAPLRKECPMNLWRPVRARALSPEAAANVRRIDALWADCRARFGTGGAFLFGTFGSADAMYAPVVARFHTYAIDVGPESRAYMDAVVALPAYAEWKAAGVQEPWVMSNNEVDWPDVPRVPA
jgi:glutathione S-transferase